MKTKTLKDLSYCLMVVSFFLYLVLGVISNTNKAEVNKQQQDDRLVVLQQSVVTIKEEPTVLEAKKEEIQCTVAQTDKQCEVEKEIREVCLRNNFEDEDLAVRIAYC